MSLAVPAVLLIAFVVYGLVWVCWRLAHLPARRRPYQSVGHQRLDLSEERDIHRPTRLERILRDELGREAARCLTDDDLDGLVIDWDDEMRRRGR